MYNKKLTYYIRSKQTNSILRQKFHLIEVEKILYNWCNYYSFNLNRFYISAEKYEN